MKCGVRMGWRERLPRTQAVFARTSHWSQPVGFDVAEPETIENREFREGLGGLVFSAGILTFVRPFLGPLWQNRRSRSRYLQ